MTWFLDWRGYKGKGEIRPSTKYNLGHLLSVSCWPWIIVFFFKDKFESMEIHIYFSILKIMVFLTSEEQELVMIEHLLCLCTIFWILCTSESIWCSASSTTSNRTESIVPVVRLIQFKSIQDREGFFRSQIHFLLGCAARNKLKQGHNCESQTTRAKSTTMTPPIRRQTRPQIHRCREEQKATADNTANNHTVIVGDYSSRLSAHRSHIWGFSCPISLPKEISGQSRKNIQKSIIWNHSRILFICMF